MVDWFIIAAPLLAAILCGLLAFTGCEATVEPADPLIVALLEYDVQDIAEPPTVIFQWTVAEDDVQGSGIGGPIRPGATEGRMVSKYHIPGQPGDWRVWCSVFLSLETGDVELVRESICEFSIDQAEFAARNVRFEVTRREDGELAVRCVA